MDNNIIDTELPDGIAGLTDGKTVWLNNKLTPQGRRCTLAHELTHIKRGIIPNLPAYLYAREEKKVDEEAARALVPLTDLVDAIVWEGCDTKHAALAEVLDIDRDTLTARLTTASPTEAVIICRALLNLPQVP